MLSNPTSAAPAKSSANLTSVKTNKAASVLHAPSLEQPVGCDDGHYAIKICAGPDTFFTILSRAAFGRAGVSSISGAQDNDLIYETATGEFVTITADHLLGDAVDTRTPDYPTSSPNRALVAHALRAARVKDEVFLVTGLPVNRFYLEGARNDVLIEGKRESLMRPVSCLSGAPAPRVTRHKVISEAIAAYFDKLLNFDGSFNKEFKDLSDQEAVAVVDVGGRTLDIATVKEGGSGLYQQQSGTADVGALYLYDTLDRALRQQFSGNDVIPFNRLQHALTTGQYRLYGKLYDVSEIVNDLLDSFADRIAFESKKLLGDASRFGQVLFVGGGANLLSTRLNRVFPNLPPEAITCAPVSDDPRTNASFANARGMFKAARVELNKA